MTSQELDSVLGGAFSDWRNRLEMWPCIQSLGIKPYKDGNQWCFLYGNNIQDGVCGFGKTIYEAAVSFYNNLIHEQL